MAFNAAVGDGTAARGVCGAEINLISTQSLQQNNLSSKGEVYRQIPTSLPH
ncbi:MAG: hypothetical protein LBB79_07175 [Prevotellaceae bacterium]|jgi:hypothetical protein|nr:hypothetical protein [Prevotellaceae bacterium]